MKIPLHSVDVKSSVELAREREFTEKARQMMQSVNNTEPLVIKRDMSPLNTPFANLKLSPS